MNEIKREEQIRNNKGDEQTITVEKNVYQQQEKLREKYATKTKQMRKTRNMPARENEGNRTNKKFMNQKNESERTNDKK